MDLFTEIGKATNPNSAKNDLKRLESIPFFEGKKKTIPQWKQILVWLQAGKTLTPIEALNMFGCFRLSARIDDLRKKGYNIPNPAEKIKTSSGKRIAKYKLVKEYFPYF